MLRVLTILIEVGDVCEASAKCGHGPRQHRPQDICFVHCRRVHTLVMAGHCSSACFREALVVLSEEV